MSPKTWLRLLGLSCLLIAAGFVVPGLTQNAKKGKKAAKDEITNSVGMKFVRVKAGKFTMGSPDRERSAVYELIKDNYKDGQPDWLKAEGPQHEVEITKDFYLGVYEVTQGQFRQVMGFNPSYFSIDGKAGETGNYFYTPAGGKEKVKGFKQKELDDFPVENVSWDDAQAFLKRLNARAAEKKHKVEYRLPTEAEWEYACRGGPSSSTKPFHFKSPSDSLGAGQANFDASVPYGGGKKGEKTTRPNTVGKNGGPNALGLYDMHGNVWEWCADWHDMKYYGKSPTKDPQGPISGSDRVFRGGSWFMFGWGCRATYRSWFTPEYRSDSLGFRLAAVPHEK